MDLLKSGQSEEQFGINELRQIAARTSGALPRPWLWSAPVRMGVVYGRVLCRLCDRACSRRLGMERQQHRQYEQHQRQLQDQP